MGRPFPGAGVLSQSASRPAPRPTTRSTDDPKIRALGVAHNRRALDFRQIIGAKLLIGPYHSALNHVCDYSPAPTADEWRWGVDSMREVAEHAATLGIMLAPEYVNRFECYLVNTAADMVRFVHQVDHPNCRMLYDTFHANIEEKDIRQAILKLPGRNHPRPYLGERPRHSRHRARRLDHHVRRAEGDRLRRLDVDRGLWPGGGAARLAAAVRRRDRAGPGGAGLHERPVARRGMI